MELRNDNDDNGGGYERELEMDDHNDNEEKQPGKIRIDPLKKPQTKP